MVTQGNAIHFRRVLWGVLLQEWNEVLNILSSISFTHELDNIAWSWEASGHFTVKSMYSFLNFRGIQVHNPLSWCKLPVPPKIQAFMWLSSKTQDFDQKKTCRIEVGYVI